MMKCDEENIVEFGYIGRISNDAAGGGGGG